MKFTWLTLPFLFAVSVTQAEQINECSRDGFDLTYISNTDDGIYKYWEENRGSSSSNAVIERLDAQGGIVWSAKAERGCTQGVSRCYLMLPYALDGEQGGALRIEMNWASLGGQSIVVFSHLSEHIIYTYFKVNPFKEFSLISSGAPFEAGHEESDFIIPNVFETTC